MISITPGSSLLLSAIGELSTNDFRLVVVEARPQSTAVETLVGLARPITPDATSRGFEMTWRNYVAYVVRNESYFKQEQDEDPGKSLLGTRENTAFLRYIQDTTFATSDYPGPLTHWFVYTEWQCIDVISNSPPDIRELAENEVATAVEASLLANAPSVMRAS